MEIEFACGSCREKFSADESLAGRRSKCPACGHEIQVPLPTTSKPAISPPLIPPPILQPVMPSIPNAGPANVTQSRPLWKNHVVVIGAAVLMLTLVYFSHMWVGPTFARAEVIQEIKDQPSLSRRRITPARRNPYQQTKSRPHPRRCLHRQTKSRPHLRTCQRSLPRPLRAPLVERWAAVTSRIMHDYEPQTIPTDNRGQWPIWVPLQGRVHNFPVGTVAIVRVGEDKFNKDPRLSESGAVIDGSIVLKIPENRQSFDPFYRVFPEVHRLYDRSIKAGDPVGINMVIASTFAFRVKTGTRVRVVNFKGNSQSTLPRDERFSGR